MLYPAWLLSWIVAVIVGTFVATMTVAMIAQLITAYHCLSHFIMVDHALSWLCHAISFFTILYHAWSWFIMPFSLFWNRPIKGHDLANLSFLVSALRGHFLLSLTEMIVDHPSNCKPRNSAQCWVSIAPNGDEDAQSGLISYKEPWQSGLIWWGHLINLMNYRSA